jgi:F0F1-type ATP synthase delta subunit
VNLNLPIDLYSIDQLSAVIIELRNYIGDLHDRNVRKKLSKDHSEALPQISALLLGVLHGAETRQGDLAAAEKTLKALQDLRNNAPTIRVALPDIPDRTLKRQFTVWFRTQINPTTLLSFALRTDIGGGAIIQSGSHVYDFSLKAKIINNREQIYEIYKRKARV